MKLKICSVIMCVFLTGCIFSEKNEPSFKQQVSVSNAKCATASAEYKAATTDAQRLSIASDYFSTAPKELQLIDDAAWGRDPSVDPVTPDITVQPVTPKPASNKK